MVEEEVVVAEQAKATLKAQAEKHEAEMASLKDQMKQLQFKIDVDAAKLACLKEVAPRESKEAQLEVELKAS